MPKRTRSSGGSEGPVPDPPSKRTRSASKSPGSAPPKQPKQSQKPKAKGATKKPKLITLEAKPEHWLNKLPDNHGTYYFLRLGDNLGSATGKRG